eukprot:4871534-Amphidinium_carterae.2
MKILLLRNPTSTALPLLLGLSKLCHCHAIVLQLFHHSMEVAFIWVSMAPSRLKAQSDSAFESHS